MATLLLINAHQVNNSDILKVQSCGITEIRFLFDLSALFKVHLSPVETKWCSNLKQENMQDVMLLYFRTTQFDKVLK